MRLGSYGKHFLKPQESSSLCQIEAMVQNSAGLGDGPFYYQPYLTLVRPLSTSWPSLFPLVYLLYIFLLLFLCLLHLLLALFLLFNILYAFFTTCFHFPSSIDMNCNSVFIYSLMF